jgi:hypothetical protein
MAAVPNYQGIWWNAPAASESGWGVNLAHQGDTIFAAWYTYDTNGRALWLTMTAEKVGPNAYSGKLYENRGPALNAQPFNPGLVQQNEVGDATLTFADAENGMFRYTVNGVTQTKPLVRFAFGPMPTCTWGALADLSLATNYQDMWWASPPPGAESGWGVTLTHQGDVIFVAWFTYDLDGKPLWLSATVRKVAPGVYTGAIHRTTGPAYSATPWNPNTVTDATIGELTITFANGNRASFHYTLSLGAPPVAIDQTKTIERFVFRAPGTVCAEAAGGVATAEGIWRGTTNQGQAVTIVILDDGTLYIVFSAQGTTTEAGVLHGSGTSVNGNFNATSVKEYPLSPTQPPFLGGATAIHGTYVPRSTLQLTIGSSSVTAAYDPTYDQPANLASLAGAYDGTVGHITEQRPATLVMDNVGNLTINGVQCVFAVSANARGRVNMFNISVSSSSCYNGPGVMFYDSARRKLYALAAFYNGLLGFLDVWYAIGTRQ